MTKIDITKQPYDVSKYKPAEKFIRVNDDPDLIPIKIYLPKPPDLKLIAGYGLHPEDQVWQRPKIPERLRKIELDSEGNARTLDEIWQFLNLNKFNYKEEIDFIRTQWYHRIYGYWFFNNGVPTYITGKHYYYLTASQIDVGYPLFKNRDRKYWIFIDFCLNDTYDFINKDDKGNAIPDKDGYYEFFDTGRRVCLGHIYPKFRREGATYKANADHLETITKDIQGNGGIQSRDEEDARKVFKKLSSTFKKIPFYFKPSYTSGVNSPRKIEFDVLNKGGRGGVGAINLGLESIIDYGSGLEGDYDGLKLAFYHEDEIGKTTKYDINLRHNITKEALSTDGGRNIIGYTHKTSTVGEMESGGGEQFKKLCDNSNFYQRSKIGQTVSGLYLIFISSKDGIDFDKYGVSNETAVEEDFLSQRKSYLDNKDNAGWEEHVRKFPLYYRECFTSTSNDIGFNNYKLTTRISELIMMKNRTRRGNFYRVGDIHSRVIFKDNDNGKFELSHLLSDDESNRKYQAQGVFFPAGKRFVAAGDAFKMSNTAQEKHRSLGGGAVFWRREKYIDPDVKDVSNWISNRFVCTYLFRPPTTDEYADDMLMMCQYYSAMMLPETNENLLVEYFQAAGYGGYLIYLRDIKGSIKNVPGVYASDINKQVAMQLMRNHIELHCGREKHLELLQQCEQITGLKYLTKYDLLASAIWALYADEYGYFNYLQDVSMEEEQNNIYDLGNYFRRR